MDSVSIGLDIGSSAVRAAEIDYRAGRRSIRRYAQVGLPHGFVVDGEIVNQIGVAEALRRLWAEAGFSTNRVVVGVSGPRVFVRQAEVTAMNREDLRSSLRFNAQELVPISLEDASFDFSVLDEHPAGGSSNDAKMTILLVAGHPDVLRTYLDVLKQAGLTAVAMDSTALALVRAVPAAPTTEGRTGLDVVVSVGAELTTVAVRENGIPRFIRSLTVGGAKLTTSLADSLHLEPAVAERLKRGAVAESTPQLAQVRRALGPDIRDLAEDVRATVDFFMGQAEGDTFDRLLITGGASQTEGLATAIGGDLPVEIYQVDPFSGFATEDLGLTESDRARATASATTSIGLALWPFEAPMIRLSVLPEEVFRVRRNRQKVKVAAVGLAAVTGLLVVAGLGRMAEVSSARGSAASAERQVTTLQANVNSLEAKTAVHGQMEARGQMDVSALSGDVDYIRVLAQLAEVMPPQLSLQSASISRTTGTSSSASGSTSDIGTVNFTVSGHGDAKTAASWLTALQGDPDFSSSWISGVSISDGKVNFSSTSNLTSTAEDSRSEAAKP